ncbi:unnamed protein product [Phytophthora fragariaefolia]|uniref:Unnamed protein product n=1 Tax=Phytophthora fragariaefolia TaxID=1490495 RepID=A0A9W7CKW5_9STRA|nr:unnamed protein product [Phytophthora fragariaefolia]
MHEGVAFDPAEHTPRARCEIPIRQIPPCHPRTQRFGGFAGWRDAGGKESHGGTNRRVEEQARITEPNSRSHLRRIEPRNNACQHPEDAIAKRRVRFSWTPAENAEASPVEPVPPDLNDATTESSHVENGEISPGAAARPPSAEEVDPLEVQEERRRRVGRAQDEELRWANLKLVLKGESSSLGYKTAREAWKLANQFVLSDDGLLYFLGENRTVGGAKGG